ncbi:glycosyltransferase [[Clostridium] polysaccharolyticum]|uniref:UDP:flavonoid glycosyltransferase YjiC, YdhE family n=1 Tax=[Clostridium] polysaccharolyticum TaxID=29364 RepID=A0A1I0DYD8_9FIRM|nr:glycosyltransferase [[Clostridium] polysaccharolyticum]SET37734.1 UDP:flavonoid glycosyltransferase YjiC, YdhE family [[Clostridium] polysaccharolyticum]
MKVIYFSMPYAGHINPNIPLFQELVKKKVDIYIFGDEGYLSKILGNEGITYIQLPEYVLEYSKIQSTDFKSEEDCAEKYFSMIYKEDILKEKAFQETSLQIRFYNEYLSIVKNISPDCIMYDSYAFYMKKIIEDEKVKYIDINCAMTVLEDYYKSDSWKEYLTDIVLTEVANAPSVEQICLSIRHMQRFKRRLELNEKSKEVKINYYCYNSDLLQYKEGASDKYPHYMGYHLEVPKAIDKDHSIFVSRGTMSDSYGMLMLKKTLECVDGINYKCQVSVGNNQNLLEQLQQKKFSDNIHLNLYVNQIECLSKADIFITHGGISGVREALFCGTPMILCPTNYLDFLLAKQLEQSGAGILIKGQSFNRDGITQAIDFMNKNIEKYRKGTDRLAEQLTETWNRSGIQNVIDFIQV